MTEKIKFKEENCGEHLMWHQVSGKQWDVYNYEHEFIGWLQYERVGRFMQWCWYQYQNIRMSPGCLQEVRDKQKELWVMKNKQ